MAVHVPYAAHAKKNKKRQMRRVHSFRYENTGSILSIFYYSVTVENNTLARSARNYGRANLARNKKNVAKYRFPATHGVSGNCSALQNKPANDSCLCHNTAAHVYARASVCI